MGINLFPEFRGGEIRLVYAQFMRVLHHVLGVRYFYLTSYGMGEGNPEAIRTGAFWFYRKLGFTATDPGVEALARVEEAKLQRHPGYRTSPHMLRRLSHTDACFDISSGACRRLDLGALGLRQSRLIAGEFGGDRRLAEARCTAQIAHLLDLGDVAAGTPARQHALRILAPVLCMIPDLARWPAADKRRLARILAQKGGRSEGPTDRLINGHRRLLAALRELASPADPGLE
jgi:hypothetical protein